ncbi:unnamed protein product [Soboliphyme baturini]|uniref:Uncharacterized protein n=1 Tax=Soboliphyme baturini TaxID=241478 RepID=A0A183IEP9_9BILA|nr:unnamed protein product [Soboliphyme baturini]
MLRRHGQFDGSKALWGPALCPRVDQTAVTRKQPKPRLKARGIDAQRWSYVKQDTIVCLEEDNRHGDLQLDTNDPDCPGGWSRGTMTCQRSSIGTAARQMHRATAGRRVTDRSRSERGFRTFKDLQHFLSIVVPAEAHNLVRLSLKRRETISEYATCGKYLLCVIPPISLFLQNKTVPRVRHHWKRNFRSREDKLKENNEWRRRRRSEVIDKGQVSSMWTSPEETSNHQRINFWLFCHCVTLVRIERVLHVEFAVGDELGFAGVRFSSTCCRVNCELLKRLTGGTSSLMRTSSQQCLGMRMAYLLDKPGWRLPVTVGSHEVA